MSRTFPNITPVSWLPARQVLGGEASDFTPWLQQESSLEVLGRALKLDDLMAVKAEHNVLGKRLDILARALDENGEEIPVCIENQYGMSDADHLGRLIAYLAQHERGRAVWIVEQAHDAFVAAVRFLNRTSVPDVGYYLVQVRFTHGLDGGYQVHFEVLAAPIAWERTGARQGGTHQVNQSKVSYLSTILETVEAGLLASGFPNMNMHARGSYLWIQWPFDLWYRTYSRRLDIRVTKDQAIVAIYVSSFDTKEANATAADIMRECYEKRLAAELPDGTEVVWDAVGSGNRKVVRLELSGGGYQGGDAVNVAAWAVSCCTTLLGLLRGEPLNGLEAEVALRLPGASVSSAEGFDDTAADD